MNSERKRGPEDMGSTDIFTWDVGPQKASKWASAVVSMAQIAVKALWMEWVISWGPSVILGALVQEG